MKSNLSKSKSEIHYGETFKREVVRVETPAELGELAWLKRRRRRVESALAPS